METQIKDLDKLKVCPINFALREFDKKWSLNIIKSIFMGRRRFNEISNDFPDLSNKVLSDRLKELEENNIIKKKIKSTTPLLIEYHLTEKGKSLNKVIFELAMYTIKNYGNKIYIHSEKELDNCKRVLTKIFLQ